MLRLLNNKSGFGHRIAAALLAFSLAWSFSTRAASYDEAYPPQATVTHFAHSHGALATHVVRQALAFDKSTHRTIHTYAVVCEPCAPIVDWRARRLFRLDWIHPLKPGVYSLIADRSPPESTPLA
jgi:hypothetical protein